MDALGRKFGLHRTTIIAQLVRRGVRRRLVRKMTDTLVARASERYSEGLSIAAVAAEFAVLARTLTPGIPGGRYLHQRTSRFGSLHHPHRRFSPGYATSS